MLTLFAAIGLLTQSLPAWCAPAIAELKRDGVLVGIPEGLLCYRGERTPTQKIIDARYEYAVGAFASYKQLEARTNSEGFRASTKSLDLLARLTREMKLELISMGVDSSAYSKMIADFGQWRKQNETLFRDVPATHWAAPAVRALKAEGLLKGYPDQTFRGGR